jgi:uridine phosphorylase
LFCGAPGRTEQLAIMYLEQMAENYFDEKCKIIYAKYRGIVTATGYYKEVLITLATSGMGVPSMNIVLDELIRVGAKIVIRLGSCGSLIDDRPGKAIIVENARAWGGSSKQWLPPWQRWFCSGWHKAEANPLIVQALHLAARQLENAGAIGPGLVYSGTELTVDDFTRQQGRPNLFGEISLKYRLRHFCAMLFNLGACYSMEAAGLFLYALFHTKGLVWAGAINATVADRWEGLFEPGAGNSLVGLIGFEAAVILAQNGTVTQFLSEPRPDFW